MLSDDKDKDGGLLSDYSPTTALSTSLSSITLPAKDQFYSITLNDKASIIAQTSTPTKDRSSSAPLENTASSTNVPVSEPNKDETTRSTAVGASSSSSKSEATAPTASILTSNLDQTNVIPYLATVTSVITKDDGSVSASTIFTTFKDEHQASSSLVTASYDKPTNVAATGSPDLTIPDKDRTASKVITKDHDTTSSPSLSESPAFTVPDKDKTTPISSEKDEKTGNPSSLASTASDQYKSSFELLRTTERTATSPPRSSTSQSLSESDKSRSTSVTVDEKAYSTLETPISSGPEKGETQSTQQGSSPILVPAQYTITTPAKDQEYTALEVTSKTSAPKQEQTVSSLPFDYQESSSSSSSPQSSRQETSSRNVPDKDKASPSLQIASSTSIPDENKTSASSQVTSNTSVQDKDKSPTYSSANDHTLFSEKYANPSSSLDKDQIKSSHTSSKNQVTSASKDQPTSSIVPAKDQTTTSDISSDDKQTSSLVSVENPSSGTSRLYDSKASSSSIPGSLVYHSIVTLSSSAANSRVTLTTIDSLPAKDQTRPPPSNSIPATYKVISFAVTSSPSIPTQGARESIISKILLSFGISTPPKEEQPVTAFENNKTSSFPLTVPLLSDAVTTPAFVTASTGIGSVSVASTSSDTALITPKPETLIQTRVTYPGEGLVPTTRVVFLNTSSVIPVWTPAMLGNAYGGGYIITPSIFVTSLPNSPKSSNGIPPGYELSSKSEDISPPNYVPTPVIVKVGGSTTEFSGDSTLLSSTQSKDETNKPSNFITPSVGLNVEGSVTAYPGASTPTTPFIESKIESNKPSGVVNPSVTLVEGKTSGPPGASSPISLLTGLKSKPNKPSDSLTLPIANKVEGTTTRFPTVSTSTALISESKNESDKSSDSTPTPNSSLIAYTPEDQTSGSIQTQDEIPKSSNRKPEQETVTSGPSPSISTSRLYNSALPSAESKDESEKSTGVTHRSPISSDDLPGKTLIPLQPSSVRDKEKADKTSDLASVDIPTFSKVTFSTSAVSKDKTDELTTFSLPPSADASIARISLSPLEPGYNESTISASRPTSVLEFEGVASKYSIGLSWKLIAISASILLF